jgi:hypothetical protein
MTLRDPETIEALRDEPELLAIADAFAATQRPAPRRLRGIAPGVAAAAALAAAVALAVLLWPTGGGGDGVLGRALAAIGDGRVLHLVLESRGGEELVDLRTGRRTPVVARVESWRDGDSGREHVVIRIGDTITDALVPDDLQEHGLSSGPTDPALDALWKGYRRALADGAAFLDGRGVVDGHPVYWLHFPSFGDRLRGTKVAIDRKTYKPVLVRRDTGDGAQADSRVLTAETIPYDGADFERVGVKFYGSVVAGGSTPPSDPDAALKAPWLTVGKRAAGLELYSYGIDDLPLPGRRVREVELSFGDGTFPPRSLTITEQEQPDFPGYWAHIPPGVVSIQRGKTSDDKRFYPTWTGALVRNGIHVRIETGAGEQAVLEVARALRAAP